MWKDFFYFTRTEQRGIILLAVLAIGAFLSPEMKRLFSTTHEEGVSIENERSLQEYERFIASLRKDTFSHHKTSVSVPHKKATFTADHLSPFDPNTADSLTFRTLGLPAWMTSNILRYRRKQGKFRRAEDFRKIYGLTEEQYQTLYPYIHIDTRPFEKDTLHLLTTSDIQRDTVFKYPIGSIIELNKADTTELKKIPGIGSRIANLIVQHRKRLGGYHDIEQLKEIHLKAELLRPWFSIDTTCIRRINVNQSGVERLMRHPYINFYQAKALVEYRQKHGNIKSLVPFSFYEEFTENDLRRIASYICYE